MEELIRFYHQDVTTGERETTLDCVSPGGGITKLQWWGIKRFLDVDAQEPAVKRRCQYAASKAFKMLREQGNIRFNATRISRIITACLYNHKVGIFDNCVHLLPPLEHTTENFPLMTPPMGPHPRSPVSSVAQCADIHRAISVSTKCIHDWENLSNSTFTACWPILVGCINCFNPMLVS